MRTPDGLVDLPEVVKPRLLGLVAGGGVLLPAEAHFGEKLGSLPSSALAERSGQGSLGLFGAVQPQPLLVVLPVEHPLPADPFVDWKLLRGGVHPAVYFQCVRVAVFKAAPAQGRESIAERNSLGVVRQEAAILPAVPVAADEVGAIRERTPRMVDVPVCRRRARAHPHPHAPVMLYAKQLLVPRILLAHFASLPAAHGRC